MTTFTSFMSITSSSNISTTAKTTATNDQTTTGSALVPVVVGSVSVGVLTIVATMITCIVIMKVKWRQKNFSLSDVKNSEKNPSSDGGYTNALYESKLVTMCYYKVKSAYSLILETA